ncbi:unnamed protein product [Mytilus coruscus]|uniref:Transposase Helix-turn-helix domain-containing protein n=1 Tax=Mytilus coruscus TaxID=42192 RepID=A0A6J8EDS4_MYTCO|nr:unnamed protein product [Mytilus coruscus]
MEKSLTSPDIQETVELLKTKIESRNEKFEIASKNISDLQKQLEYFEKKRFSLDKIKDDNDAIAFYTGIPNYGTFMACFEYLESKASRLQYWRGQNDKIDDYKHYQTQGGRPGPRRKLTLRDELFMTLIRLKVGLFVRDLAERFEISQSQFSKIFTTWINFLNVELPSIFPFPSQEKV